MISVAEAKDRLITHSPGPVPLQIPLITELTPGRQWKMAGLSHTAALREKLEADYPQLQGVSYVLAVNQQIITTDQPLSSGAEVALMPPFSGG